MRRYILSKLISITFGVLVLCFVVGFYAFAVWQGPTADPPGGNVPPPVRLGVAEADIDATTSRSIWINDTGGGDLLCLQQGGTSRFVVGNDGNVLIESGQLSLKETTAPAEIIGYGKLYVTSDNTLYFKDEAGTVTNLLAGGLSASANETITGLWSFSNASGLKTNTITERTADSGVTIDGVLLKDSEISANYLSTTGETTGDLLYFNGTNWTRLGIGASGKYLKSDGTSPAWADVAGGIGGSGTSTQIAFFDPDGATLSSDSNLYWDDANKRLGVGVTPSYKLHVEGGSYGIYAKGDTMGGYFKDTTQSGYAHIAQGDYGVKAYGYEAGGYFESTDIALSGYAYVGKRGFGIKAYGDFMGGYFEDSTDSGWAQIAAAGSGIDAYGDFVGGHFENTSINGAWAYLATNNIGIEACATSTGAGGYFKNYNTEDRVWLANGSTGRGVSAYGNTMGGYFRDIDGGGYAYLGYGTSGGFFHSSASGYSYVGVGNYGIQANGSFMGGYFNDTDGTYSRVAYGDYGLYTPGSIHFENALLPGGAAGTSGQVLTSRGEGVVPVWGNVAGAAFTSGSVTVTSTTITVNLGFRPRLILTNARGEKSGDGTGIGSGQCDGNGVQSWSGNIDYSLDPVAESGRIIRGETQNWGGWSVSIGNITNTGFDFIPNNGSLGIQTTNIYYTAMQ